MAEGPVSDVEAFWDSLVGVAASLTGGVATAKGVAGDRGVAGGVTVAVAEVSFTAGRVGVGVASTREELPELQATVSQAAKDSRPMKVAELARPFLGI